VGTIPNINGIKRFAANAARGTDLGFSAIRDGLRLFASVCGCCESNDTKMTPNECVMAEES